MKIDESKLGDKGPDSNMALNPIVGINPEELWRAAGLVVTEIIRQPTLFAKHGGSFAKDLADVLVGRRDKPVTIWANTECIKTLREQPAVSEVFMAYLLSRNIQIEADLGSRREFGIGLFWMALSMASCFPIRLWMAHGTHQSGPGTTGGVGLVDDG